MSDFDDLRQIRAAKERAEAVARQKRMEEESQKAAIAQRLGDKKRANADELNNTVVEVLEALRNAVYPSVKVKRLGIDRWGIIREGISDIGGYEIELYAVVADIEFDSNGGPRHFVSRKGEYAYRRKETVRSGVARDDLVRSLRRLHPANTIR
jgi:hypothetical protein